MVYDEESREKKNGWKYSTPTGFVDCSKCEKLLLPALLEADIHIIGSLTMTGHQQSKG